MMTLAVSSGLLTLLLLLSLFENEIRRQKVKADRLDSFKTKSHYIDAELELNFVDRFIKPAFKRLAGRLSRSGKARSRTRKNKSDSPNPIERSLRLAGLRLQAAEYNLIRIIAIAGFTFLGFIAAAMVSADPAVQFFVIFLAMTVGVAAPTFILRALVNARQEAIQNQLPSILDVLSVSIEAGLGFDAAILKVVERYDGPLPDELALMHRELLMGKPRREALNDLAERSSIKELKTFVTAVIQADQFGTPMKNVLHNQAIQLRIFRRQQAQEKGMKAPVRMVLPMVFFIFPVIFIVLLGPTLITAIEQMG